MVFLSDFNTKDDNRRPGQFLLSTWHSHSDKKVSTEQWPRLDWPVDMSRRDYLAYLLI